jgi:hypothetical protein
MTAICTLLGSVLATSGAVWVGTHTTTDKVASSASDLNKNLVKLQTQLRSSLADVNAADVIALDAATSGDPSIQGATVHVSGILKQDLPNGVQIWSGSNVIPPGPPSAPDGSFGVDEAGPCAVDLAARTFDCGNITLGNNGQLGRFALYVGLANSGQARALTKLVTDQVRGNWAGGPPPEMKWLAPIVKVRSKS